MRLIFQKYATGTLSYFELARWLNAEGVRPPSFGRGTEGDRTDWVADGVRDVIAREAYVGRVIHCRRKNPNGPLIAGTYLAIIDEPTWDACVAVRRRNRMQHTMHYDHRLTRFALTGLLRCHRCGGTVHGSIAGGSAGDPGRRDYYRCRRRFGSRACD